MIEYKLLTGKIIFVVCTCLRSIAQSGRAQPSGGWGRRFESSCSDQCHVMSLFISFIVWRLVGGMRWRILEKVVDTKSICMF